ncbi:MAG: NADP-dependent oxidoreductase [Gammaproteobacteria bacterium]|nr:NADP-dependent oxidoreductase [Gammaproteobacteria bacterium]MYB37352.1 NADP-dependent oxidoreductase [Gammaproteobacteria bacterium]
MTANRVWSLARKPLAGWPTDGDFVLHDELAADPGPNQMLVRTIYLSLDPYQWGRRRSGMEAVGDVCHGRTVSQVVASNLAGYAPGDYVFNTNGWQDYGLVGEGIDVFGYMFPRRLDPSVAPISTAVGILGMLGLTAYAGVKVQCQPQLGETVVVSAASGGVGQAAGQIAKIHGCRVVGVAGTPEKCAFLTEELGFDAAVCRRSADYAAELARACPDGIDIYFENVGGDVYEGVLPLLNRRSRITLCGMISQYGNTDGRDAGEVWRETGASVFRRQDVEVHPLAVRNFVADWQDRFLTEMAGWMADGLVKYREDIRPGLENAPAAFADMLSGGNFGKTLIQVSEDPTRE